MAEPAVASASADNGAPGKPDMTSWHDVDVADWHWFAERRQLDAFEMPNELTAKVKKSQRPQLRKNRQSRNATKRSAIEAELEAVPADIDVEHLVKVGAASERVQRAVDKLGRSDACGYALCAAVLNIQMELSDEGRLVAWQWWWLSAEDRKRLLRVGDSLRARRERALAAWDDLLAMGWPTSDKRFRAAQPRTDLELDDTDIAKWRRILTERPPPPPPPTAEEEAARQKREQERAAYRKSIQEADERERKAREEREAQWEAEAPARLAEYEAAQERERKQREREEQEEATLLTRLLDGRPRITKENAGEWPPPYPYERRCLGEACACMRYSYNRDLDRNPRRIRKKDPFKCNSTRKDPFACYSPCSGDYVHLVLSEPHECQTHIGGRMTRTLMVSEKSEIMRWYGQLTGKLWPPRCLVWQSANATTYGVPQEAPDGSQLFIPSSEDLQKGFEEAFRAWRRLHPQKPAADAEAEPPDGEPEEHSSEDESPGW